MHRLQHSVTVYLTHDGWTLEEPNVDDDYETHTVIATPAGIVEFLNSINNATV